MKKKILFIILFIIIILIAILIFVKSQYITFDKAKELLKTSDELGDNIYKEDIFTYDGNTQITKTYFKDNIVVTKYDNINYGNGIHWINYNNNKEILVAVSENDPTNKNMIVKRLEDTNVFKNRSSHFSNPLAEKKDTDQYKYLRTETYNDTTCVVVEISNEEEKAIFWIDENNGVILKTEGYNSNNELNKVIESTYSFGIVTDEDILEPKQKDYPDYQYIDTFEN